MYCLGLAWSLLAKRFRFLGNGSQVLGSDALPYCDDGLFWKVGSVQGIVLLVSLRVLEVRLGVSDVRYLEDW